MVLYVGKGGDRAVVYVDKCGDTGVVLYVGKGGDRLWCCM